MKAEISVYQAKCVGRKGVNFPTSWEFSNLEVGGLLGQKLQTDIQAVSSVLSPHPQRACFPVGKTVRLSFHTPEPERPF